MRPVIFTTASFLIATSALAAQADRPRNIQPLQPGKIIDMSGSARPGTPSFVHVDDNSVHVVDYGDGALKKYDLPSASVKVKPTATASRAQGEIWVVNADDEVVRVYDLNHKLLRNYPIPSGATRVVPWRDGYVAIGATETFGAAYDSMGAAKSEVTVPAWVNQTTRLGRSPITAAGADQWAVAFRYTGRILVADVGSTILTELPVVESRAPLPDTVFTSDDGEFTFTKRNARSVTTVRAIAWSEGLLYVLAGGQGETAGRYVDVYDGKTRKYLRSYLLPNTAADMIVNRSGIVTFEAVGKPMMYFYPFN